MIIKKITIEFDLKQDNEFEKSLATNAVFENGCWKLNGPMKSSVHGLLHKIWQLIRTEMEKSNGNNF